MWRPMSFRYENSTDCFGGEGGGSFMLSVWSEQLNLMDFYHLRSVANFWNRKGRVWLWPRSINPCRQNSVLTTHLTWSEWSLSTLPHDAQWTCGPNQWSDSWHNLKKEDGPWSLILLLSTISKMLQIQFAICNFYFGATRDEVFWKVSTKKN